MTKNFYRGSIETLTYTIIAAAPVAAGQLVGFTDKPAAAGAPVQGVAAHDAETGEALRIVVLGLCDMEAGAVIRKGQSLAAGANGLPVPVSGTAASFGFATNDAAAGERVSVLIR